MSEEHGDGGPHFGGTLDEYSVGPLDDGTWLVLYEMLSMAIEEAPENVVDEYQEAKDDFLAAHPDEATGSPENWPESMREAWNETIMEELDHD